MKLLLKEATGEETIQDSKLQDGLMGHGSKSERPQTPGLLDH